MSFYFAPLKKCASEFIFEMYTFGWSFAEFAVKLLCCHQSALGFLCRRREGKERQVDA